MTQPSVRLHLLGGAHLEGHAGPVTGRGAQRRRIALLALLATAGRPVSRDKLIAYLWEDAGTEQARKLLSESLYVIRKALGEDALRTTGDTVQLVQEVVWSDVAAFAAALARNDDRAAAELYRGAFLDGFFISGAGEFERWVESERGTLARARAEALARLAVAAETAGQLAEAACCWRSLVDYDCFNASYAIGLMRTLDAGGDRAGALQHARTHTALLKAEFGAEPDPDVAALAKALQAAPARPRNGSTPESNPVPADAVTEPALRPANAQPERRPRTALYASVAGALLLLFSVGVVAFRGGAPRVRGPATGASSFVVVLPFTVHGSLDELREGIVELLSTNLDGAGDLRSVDPHAVLGRAEREEAIGPRRAHSLAQHFEADYYVTGDITQAGSQLQVSATLYRTAGASPITQASARGPIDSLLVLVDGIAMQMVAARGGAAEITQLALATTRSYPALKHYLKGESYYRAGHFDSAVAEFVRATGEDKGFALAEYRLSAAAEWNFDFRTARAAAQRALLNGARLPEQYQPLVRAWWQFLNGEADAAQRTYETILASYPSSIEARSGLSEVMVHFNPIRGQPLASARDALARVFALAPAHGELRYHALEYATADGNRAIFDSLFSGLDPRNPQYGSWRAVHAFTWGTNADQRAVLAELAAGDELAIGIAAARLAVHTNNFAAAHLIAQELTRAHRSANWQAGGHLLIAEMQMARGDWATAKRSLTAAGKTERDWPVELAALFALHPLAQPSREDLLQQQQALLDWQPDSHSPATTFFLAAHAAIHPQLRLYLLGLITARLGDVEHAHTYRRELERLGGARDSEKLALALARSLAGHIARARGEPQQALHFLTSAPIAAPPDFVMVSPFYSRAHDRFTIAELYRELNNHAEARRWYESLAAGYDFLYAPVARTRLRHLD